MFDGGGGVIDVVCGLVDGFTFEYLFAAFDFAYRLREIRFVFFIKL